MSEEEIDNLKKKLNYCELEYEQNGYLSVGKFNAIKEAANLIDKLQKENEELQKENEKLIEANDKLKRTKRVKAYKVYKENTELKEKIREYEIGIVKE